MSDFCTKNARGFSNRKCYVEVSEPSSCLSHLGRDSEGAVGVQYRELSVFRVLSAFNIGRPQCSLWRCDHSTSSEKTVSSLLRTFIFISNIAKLHLRHFRVPQFHPKGAGARLFPYTILKQWSPEL